jgi:glucose/mannose-6-phosphate isomerase
MSDLSPAAVQAADPQGMLSDVLDQPVQIRDALWRVESAGIPARDLPGGLVVCGMGGSAIGGDLALAAIDGRATRPISTVRGYELSPWVGEETMVLCASYSGDTEETLACFEAAGKVGAVRIALTTGGRLAAAARDEGVPVIGVPSGFQPRAAVVYMTVGALECAALCGAAPSFRDELEAAAGTLSELASAWGPEGDDDALPKELARRLEGAIPVIHGAGLTAPVARRWKTQLNENAKVPAFWAELPEANHNEVSGWGEAGELGPLRGLFLDDPSLSPRLRQRLELTAATLGPRSAGVAAVGARTGVERVLGLVLLGDLVSVYLATLRGVDPTPVDAIERLKTALHEP